MTTPRDVGRPSDEETRIDPPPMTAHGFPSVSRDTVEDAHAERAQAPLFTSADDDVPVVATPVLVGTSEPAGRWRWAAAAIATLVVVAMIGGFFLFLRPQAGTPSPTSKYAPADAEIFGEFRMDMPGDQGDQLAEFMS